MEQADQQGREQQPASRRERHVDREAGRGVDRPRIGVEPAERLAPGTASRMERTDTGALDGFPSVRGVGTRWTKTIVRTPALPRCGGFGFAPGEDDLAMIGSMQKVVSAAGTIRLTIEAGGPFHIIAGSPDRRIAGSPDRRIAGSPDRRVAGSPNLRP